MRLLTQPKTYPLNESNDQCIAHHEGASSIGHPRVSPVIGKAIQAFELDRA